MDYTYNSNMLMDSRLYEMIILIFYQTIVDDMRVGWVVIPSFDNLNLILVTNVAMITLLNLSTSISEKEENARR